MGLFHRCKPDHNKYSWIGNHHLYVETFCKCGIRVHHHKALFGRVAWESLGKANGWTLGSSEPVSPPWGELLGVKPNATKAQVDRAHREIARVVHPDVGGTSHLMSLFNNAKEKAYKQLGFK